ncbi:hypothetical protein ONZ45_g12725 [Pleurotus djamor]|nr:hypothetical protein ONZ45_g12725 [Pleurotus djamor]
MKQRENGQHYFFRTLQNVDWSRFFWYSCRVKCFSVGADDLSPAVYTAIRRYKPSDRLLLPNMTIFFCPCSPDIFDLFCHPNVAFLQLTNSDDGLEKADRVRSFFSDLPSKVPRLEHWMTRIAQEGSFQQVESSIAQAITLLPSLKTISIHPEWTTPLVTDAIRTRPHLRKLDAYDDWEEPGLLPPQLPVFAEPLGPNHFRCLKDMTITMGFEQAVRCFGPGQCILNKVTRLKMNSKYFETAETYSRMLALLPRVFPNVSELYLDANSDLVPEDMLGSSVTFDDLRPLLSLQQLTKLSLYHSIPLQFCGTDLKLIISTLKHLKTLNLNSQPATRSQPSLHLSALSELCSKGISLQVIELYVKLSPSQLSKDHRQNDEQLHPALQLLFIGAPDLMPDDIPAISKYLSRVLPDGFDTNMGFQSNLHWEEPDVFEKLREALLDAQRP